MKTFLRTAVCFFILTSTVPAQESPPPVSPPRERRPPASSSQEGQQPGYLNLSIMDALSAYGKLTGTSVVFDNTVQGQVTLPKLQELSDEKKIELIEKAVFLDGFCMLDAGDHVVAVLGLGRMPRNEGIPVYTKPEELPSGERVFSYVFKLEHRHAQQVAAVLQQYCPPTNTMAITPDEGSHSVLVTGRTSVVRRFLKLVPLLDVPEETADKPQEKQPPGPRVTPASSSGN